jgi:hypothetical protein
VIFCRNVVIYFDRESQKKLLARFADLLVPGGLLMVGHSESFPPPTPASAPAAARPTSAWRLERSLMRSLAPLRYFDREFQVDAVKILPGQYHAAAQRRHHHGAGLLRVHLPVGPGGAHRRHEPLHAAGRHAHPDSPWAARRASACTRWSADQRDDPPRRRPPPAGGQGVRRRAVLAGFDRLDVGAKNSEFVLEFLRWKASACWPGPAGRVPAQGALLPSTAARCRSSA